MDLGFFSGLLDSAVGAVGGIGLSVLGVAVGLMTYKGAKDQMGGAHLSGVSPTQRLKLRRQAQRDGQRKLNALRRSERANERMGINPTAKPSRYTTRFWDELGNWKSPFWRD